MRMVVGHEEAYPLLHLFQRLRSSMDRLVSILVQEFHFLVGLICHKIADVLGLQLEELGTSEDGVLWIGSISSMDESHDMADVWFVVYVPRHDPLFLDVKCSSCCWCIIAWERCHQFDVTPSTNLRIACHIIICVVVTKRI